MEFYLEVTMKKDAFKPYFIVFSKKNITNHQMVPVLKTECKGSAMKKSKVIYYNQMITNSDALANNDAETTIYMNMYMYNNLGDHKQVCSAKILYGDLVAASESKTH